MKISRNILLCGVLVLTVALLNGCGGGGGGGAAPVAVKFRTYSATTSTKPGEVQLRLLLPTGVSVATVTGSPKVVAPEALALSGIFTQAPFKNYTAGKYLYGTYSAAKPAGSGRDAVRVGLSLASGKLFDVGEFLTVNCSAAGGSTAKSGFTLSEVILGGAGGVDLTSQYKLDFKIQ